MRRLAFILLLLLPTMLGQGNISIRRAAAAGCTVDMSDVSLWLNWENVSCGSDSTATYSTHADNEISWDTSLAHTGTGVAIRDESALSGTCGVDSNTSSAVSHFQLDDHDADGSEVPEVEGSIGVEAQWTSGDAGGADTYHFFRCTDDSQSHISVRLSNSDGDLRAVWQAINLNNYFVDTNGGACDNAMGDNATHIIELRRAGAGGAFELLVDGTSCGTDSSGSDPPWSGTDDCHVLTNTTTTFVASVDRIGIAAGDGDFDWYDTWITQGCEDYVAP